MHACKLLTPEAISTKLDTHITYKPEKNTVVERLP